MEFSYRVSESEYRTAWRLRRSAESLRTPRKSVAVLFWVFILTCLMLLWAVVSQPAKHPNIPRDTAMTQQRETQPAAAPSISEATLLNIAPFLMLLCIWVFAVFRVPLQLRNTYRKDPMMQGQFTVNIEPGSIIVRNTAGTLFQAGWNVYEGWGRRKNVIVLFLRNGAVTILSLAGLTDFQRNELRSILSTALPKK